MELPIIQHRWSRKKKRKKRKMNDIMVGIIAWIILLGFMVWLYLVVKMLVKREWNDT